MSYPTFLHATIARASKLDAKHNQMIRIIRLLKNEGIRESNGRQPHFLGKLFVPADCKRCAGQAQFGRYSFMPTTNILRPLSSTTRHQPVSKWQR